MFVSRTKLTTDLKSTQSTKSSITKWDFSNSSTSYSTSVSHFPRFSPRKPANFSLPPRVRVLKVIISKMERLKVCHCQTLTPSFATKKCRNHVPQTHEVESQIINRRITLASVDGSIILSTISARRSELYFGFPAWPLGSPGIWCILSFFFDILELPLWKQTRRFNKINRWLGTR